MTRLRTLAAALTLSLASPVAALAHAGIHVEDAYARASGTGSVAVYFVIENHGPEADTLLSVTTDAAASATLHSTVEETDGMTSMVPVAAGLTVPGMTSHALGPRGDHLMLMGLTRPLRDGDTFDLSLTFAREGEVRVTVTIDNARRPAAGGMDHDHMPPTQ